jgi:hypothetical protein
MLVQKVARAVTEISEQLERLMESIVEPVFVELVAVVVQKQLALDSMEEVESLQVLPELQLDMVAVAQEEMEPLVPQVMVAQLVITHQHLHLRQEMLQQILVAEVQEMLLGMVEQADQALS